MWRYSKLALDIIKQRKLIMNLFVKQNNTIILYEDTFDTDDIRVLINSK